MPTPRKLKFKISSALKDIIGRDLITDDFMAVFELVKNSYDAHASRVDVIFRDLSSNSASILIIDNGKGMNFQDLNNKWLFVAYSAKSEGTEDNDYRQRIYQNRPYAGAKGIGRFSCDRLGKKLKIETTKKGQKTELLFTNWELFEKNLRDEFIDIKVDYSSRRTNSYGLRNGTVLEISELRSNWDRDKLQRLRSSLSKLISPNKSQGTNQFQINIIAKDELENDKLETNERKKVNGIVQNFIFEDLGLKTTKIEVKISSNRRLITTQLVDGGTTIYKIKEKNRFELLNNIDFTIYYLNQSAKITFAKRMGLASRLYGNIFLYKNGIRVYPFGEPTEDPLKIDERKSRKQYSRLGTSELIGQIEINGVNTQLKETSSRGDGLINNPTYEELKSCFNVVLERLEKYVVDVQEWGLSIEEDLDEYDEQKLKIKIGELINDLTNSDSILDFEYHPNFLEIIQNSQSGSAIAVLNNIRKIARRSKNTQLLSETKKIEKKLTELKSAKEDAEREARMIQTELGEKESQNLFLKSIKSQDLEDVLNLMHHIGLSTSTIQNYIKGLVFRLDSDIEIQKKEFKDALLKISSEINKINSISRFATKANFKVGVKPTKINIDEFIREYLNNVVRPFLPTGMRLTVLSEERMPFYMEIRPLELTILIDNLINNSKKAKAKNIKVTLKTGGKNSLLMSYKDNGHGISPNIQSKIFDYGFTTTDGSGLGLTHVKEILLGMNSSISLNSNNKNETEFIITFNQF